MQIRSGADISLTNRAHIRKSVTGWRVGPDGIRTYTTYRSGQLVTVCGAEAMRHSMGDQKGKSKGKDRVKSAMQRQVQDKRKLVEQMGDSMPKRQKKDTTEMAKKVEKGGGRKARQNSLVEASRSAPTLIEPAVYTGPSSAQSEEVDWGF